MTIRLLDGNHSEAILALHAEVYQTETRLAVHRRQPGFVLAAAHHGEFLVGYAYGAPLRQATSWWRDLTVPLPEDVTEEFPGRTFALIDLAVRAAWRRQGIGRDLHDLILKGRREERATAVIPPEATAARQAFQSWGWQRIARTRGPGPGASDVLLLRLAGDRAPR